MNREQFIYQTTKRGTNNMSSTIFYIIGIGRIKTVAKVKEAMELSMPLMKKDKVTGIVMYVDYENFKWILQ